MNQKENAAPVLAHGKAAGAGFRTRDAVNPSLSYHTAGEKSTEKQTEIFDALPIGSENAISPAALAALFGINQRTLRERIEKERRGGALILSSFDRSGYFRPQQGEAGKEEIRKYYQQAHNHALSILARLAPARRALDIPDGQIMLDGEDIE